MGAQFGKGQAELPGNWGFGEIANDPDTGAPLPQPIPIPPGDYLVEVVIPDDPSSLAGRCTRSQKKKT